MGLSNEASCQLQNQISSYLRNRRIQKNPKESKRIQENPDQSLLLNGQWKTPRAPSEFNTPAGFRNYH